MSEDLLSSESRRGFLQTSGLALGGLVVGFYLPGPMKQAFAQGAPKAQVYPPNAFIQIAPDNSVTLIINKLEMGQGVNTSMAQLIAEELECDWTKIRSISSGVAPVYNTVGMPIQITGGSSALKSSWEQHRKLGAGLREMLKTAAASRWSVPVTEVKAENGFITHPKKGKLSYGDLAMEANKIPLPENPPLKNAKDFKIIGKSLTRVDAPAKSDGTAIFGIDVRIPGMLNAMIVRPHIPTARLISFDEKAARAVKGVEAVVRFGEKIAVLAKNTHTARVGRDALNAKYDAGAHASASTVQMMEQFRKQSLQKGILVEERGSVDQSKKNVTQTLLAEFEFPFLAHASMEPLNYTINYDGSKCEMWAGHQMPTTDKMFACKELGLKPDDVKINTVYAGGSFGRRASKNSDYVIEACQLAKIVKKPLKIVWSREDDMRGGSYRPMNFHRVEIGFDAKNKMQSWDHHIVGQTVMGNSPMAMMLPANGVEQTVVEGVAGSKYDLPVFRVQQTKLETPMTTLWWRSVGHTHTAYAMETMIDEIAEKQGEDPLAYRMKLAHKSPRHMAVLKQLKTMTGWGSKKPAKGRAWGLAVHESFDSVVGQVAEVSMNGHTPIVHQVWCVVNCGTVVNPEGAKTQVEGAIVYGLSAAFNQQIEVKNGEIVQGNFSDYPVLRIQDMPKVHVEFVKTEDPPTGLGEPGLPPIAPAVANAIYRLNKKRLRRLPFSRELGAIPV